eukprot:1047602-Rhodomonas_salina.1
MAGDAPPEAHTVYTRAAQHKTAFLHGCTYHCWPRTEIPYRPFLALYREDEDRMQQIYDDLTGKNGIKYSHFAAYSPTGRARISPYEA